jgi:hypothetical protein
MKICILRDLNPVQYRNKHYTFGGSAVNESVTKIGCTYRVNWQPWDKKKGNHEPKT